MGHRSACLLLLVLAWRRCGSVAPGAALQGLGSALLNENLMPPSLLLQSRVAPSSSSTPAISNATVTVAISTMGFHRKMMNEYLCRGYMAEDILARLQSDADGNDVDSNSLQQRRGSSSSTPRHQSSAEQTNHRSGQLLADQGSSNYRDWLARSAVLQDIYRRYEHVGDEMDEMDLAASSRQSDLTKDDDYNDGEVTGWAVDNKPHWSAGKQDNGQHASHHTPHHAHHDEEEFLKPYYHHHHDFAETEHHDTAHKSASLSLGVDELFDIALTALALLAFGIFKFNLILSLVQPNSTSRTVVISNLTVPFRNREGAQTMDGEFTHERVARWVEPEPERVETAEEAVARLALASLHAALLPPTTHAHCVQAALCTANKESRHFEGYSKYWLPIWSLGMSWLSRRGGGSFSKLSTSSLYSGALENLRASTLGLAGAKCHELFPSCPKL